MTIILPFPVGSILQFSYPRPNRVRVPTRLLPRMMVVEQVRDCELDPIEESALQRSPDLRRGKWLVTGHDLVKHVERSFYLDSARRIRESFVPLSRLALYDPLDPCAPLYFSGPIWTDSRIDRVQIRETVRIFHELADAEGFSKLVVGLFPYRITHQGHPSARAS